MTSLCPPQDRPDYGTGVWEPFGEPMNPFTLTYRGPLPPTANKSSGKAKKRKDPEERKQLLYDMRCQLHHQLLDVWQNNHPLTTFLHNGKPSLLEPYRKDGEGSTSFYTRSVGHHLFAPLVIDGTMLKLICELTIKFLWRDDPGSIVNNNGDIDNRLKPLFDVLTIPQIEQLPSSARSVRPPDDQMPFLVLLDDDKLITRLSVETSRLHRPIHGDERESDIELDISVVVKASSRSRWKLP
jgi:hypothetical protein